MEIGRINNLIFPGIILTYLYTFVYSHQSINPQFRCFYSTCCDTFFFCLFLLWPQKKCHELVHEFVVIDKISTTLCPFCQLLNVCSSISEHDQQCSMQVGSFKIYYHDPSLLLDSLGTILYGQIILPLFKMFMTLRCSLLQNLYFLCSSFV